MFRCKTCNQEIDGIRSIHNLKDYCQQHYFEELAKEMVPGDNLKELSLAENNESDKIDSEIKNPRTEK